MNEYINSIKVNYDLDSIKLTKESRTILKDTISNSENQDSK